MWKVRRNHENASVRRHLVARIKFHKALCLSQMLDFYQTRNAEWVLHSHSFIQELADRLEDLICSVDCCELREKEQEVLYETAKKLSNSRST